MGEGQARGLAVPCVEDVYWDQTFEDLGVSEPLEGMVVVVPLVALYFEELVRGEVAAVGEVVVVGCLATDSDKEDMKLEVGRIAGCWHLAWGEDHAQEGAHGWVEGVPALEVVPALEGDQAL